MSIEIHNLRYAGVYEEPDGSYQVDHSGTPGDFLAFPYQEGSLDFKGAQEQLDPTTGKMRLDGHDEKILGIRSCSGNISCVLHSHGLDLDGDVAPPTTSTWALMRVLKAIFGGTSSTGNPSAQTTVQAGSTTTVVNVTAGHGVRFTAGQPIAVPTAVGSPLLEVAEILSIAVDAITLKEALSGAPITGQPVRGGVTFYPTENPSTSLQWLIEGREASDGAIYRGMQGGFTIQLPVGPLGVLSFALQGAGWDRLGASSITIPSYPIFQPMALNPIEVHVPTVGSSTRVVVENSAVTLEPNFVYGPVKSGAAAETIKRMRRQPVRPLIKGTFTAPYEDDTWFDARDNREDRAVFIKCGNLAGGIFFFSIPKVQIVDVQPAPSEMGIAGNVVSFEGRHDTAIGGATELGYAAFRATAM